MRSIRESIEMYVQGTKTGDVAILREVFHNQATMSGDLYDKKFISVSPDIFFQAIDGKKAPEDYTWAYEIVEEVNEIAVVKVIERNLMNTDFISLFNLQLIEDDWVITAKIFSTLEG